MPRNAAAAMSAGPTTPFEELLDRGRSQGRLSLTEVRRVLQDAGITPTQGRSIIRELTDAGVRLAGDDEAETTSTKKRTATVKKGKASRATASASRAGTGETTDAGTSTESSTKTSRTSDTSTRSEAKATRATARGPETEAAADIPADAALGDLRATEAETEADDFAVDTLTDLDDQSSVMGDSVHTYLKAIGRRQLLTASQEV